MSFANRKGYITVKTKGGQSVSLHKDSRQIGRMKHRMKQAKKQHSQRVREYKDQLRARKKQFPLEQRAHLTMQDLMNE